MSPQTTLLCFTATVAYWLAGSLSVSAEPGPPVSYQTEIRPILERCLECHGPDLQEGGLRLDVRRRAYLGGDSGAAIDRGSSVSSELIRRICATEQSRRMPPSGDPLTAGQIDSLRRWIDQRAPWPDELAGHEDHEQHWSFRPLRRPAFPAIGRPVHNAIDAFVVARLERERIELSPEADRRTLIRRLSLDLTGLPPTPEEVNEFASDERPEAWERLVDRLLQSPRFGERWGKHWLDLSRFAESDGYENDGLRRHAWRYRDWVIEAINRDLPFDAFTIEQLAGDLLPDSRPDQRIAAGFHRNTLHNSAGGADDEEFRTKAVKDRTATTGLVWMGLTFNCCECHSHKYDPIAHREYYGLYAFFNSTDDASEGEAPTLKALQRTTFVHKRGNFLDEGPKVDPDTPVFLPPLRPRGAVADRLDLARWLVSSEHPLTARVAVNHVWQHLFGRGLVSTPENFGRKGEPPFHPELLDHLAIEFSQGPLAWSRKALIRRIVTSVTYRQASLNRPELAGRDPENRLLWRQNRFRLEAEVIRDLALAAGGLLDPAVGGPSVQPPLPAGLAQLSELKNENFQESTGNRHRRGLYVHMQRTFPFPMFAAFDSPDGNQCLVARDRSTTPMQALAILNEPSMDECAKALGQRLTKATQDVEGRLRFAFELCLGRSPNDAEVMVLRTLVARQQADGASEQAVWHGVARTILNLDEFITRE